jgi:hypothetical protein
MGSTAHIHTVERSHTRININNEQSWKHEVSNHWHSRFNIVYIHAVDFLFESTCSLILPFLSDNKVLVLAVSIIYSLLTKWVHQSTIFPKQITCYLGCRLQNTNDVAFLVTRKVLASVTGGHVSYSFNIYDTFYRLFVPPVGYNLEVE